MTKEELFSIVDYIVEQSLLLAERYVSEKNLIVDFVDIFSRDEEEKEELLQAVNQLGKIVDKPETGTTFVLENAYKARIGDLHLIKIRNLDKEKSQRGALDFKVGDYNNFKNKYINSGNFKLINRETYEMLELQDDKYDVLVYFPNIPLSEDLKI